MKQYAPLFLIFSPVAVVLGFFAMLVLQGCEESEVPADKKIVVETKLSDAVLPRISDARVVVLPTGERVLVLTGDEGLATCCLLPPKPPPQVEKP